MPTIPSKPTEPHELRHVAESFGTDAERYDRTRPRYPQAMIDRIVAASPGPDLLDVGIGTGIAARQFLAAGCQVRGVEPDAQMAAFARRDGLAVDEATFETWEPAGRSFDAVIAGQTWHWVDPVAGAAKAASALRPGGRLALFWNVFDAPPDLQAAFAEVYRRVIPDLPWDPGTNTALDLYSTLLDRAADGMRQASGFGTPQRWRFDWEHSYTRDQWLDVLPTHGGNTRLPPAALAELLAGTGAVIDAEGGSFTTHYTTVVLTATRTGAA